MFALRLLNALPVSATRRWRLLRFVGVTNGPAGVEDGVRFWNANVRLAEGAYVNRGVTFEGSARVSIGEKVALGPGVMILTSTHELGPSTWRAGDGLPVYRGVSIGAGSWVGARAVILPGVTIGRGCVIAAGAVVREDCPNDTFWAGVPAEQKSMPLAR